MAARSLAVLDTAPFSAKLWALPRMLARPALAAKGAYFLARLRLAGVPVHAGATLLRATGTTQVDRALEWSSGGTSHTTACDAIGIGHGLRAETQLADLAGCSFEWHRVDQAWLPVADAAGRSSVPGVYLAGDGAAILGADAAEASGARAALAALQDLGRPVDAAVTAHLDRARRTHLGFRAGMETAFALPARWAAQAPTT